MDKKVSRLRDLPILRKFSRQQYEGESVVEGTVVSLYLLGTTEEAVVPVDELYLLPSGRSNHLGHPSGIVHTPAHHHPTMLEIEVVEALESLYDIGLRPEDARRNIITRGVSLNKLVGQRFRIGEVAMRGVGLCEPFTDLAQLIKTRPYSELGNLVDGGGWESRFLTEALYVQET